jgi:predicted RNA-binding Zn-ribbon protein involved in translation (DUF1610 family)
MPLLVQLRDVTLSHPCPFCGQEIRKKGGWFHATFLYKCMSCRRLVPLRHSDKISLANSHADVNTKFPDQRLST